MLSPQLQGLRGGKGVSPKISGFGPPRSTYGDNISLYRLKFMVDIIFMEMLITLNVSNFVFY